MKSLKQYINECGLVAIATPINTIGMGNPQCPDDDCVGTEPIVVGKPHKLKKINKKKTNEKIK